MIKKLNREYYKHVQEYCHKEEAECCMLTQFIFVRFILIVCVRVVSVSYVCAGICGGQNRVVDLLELELQLLDTGLGIEQSPLQEKCEITTMSPFIQLLPCFSGSGNTARVLCIPHSHATTETHTSLLDYFFFNYCRKHIEERKYYKYNLQFSKLGFFKSYLMEMLVFI